MDSYPAHKLLTGREITRHRLRGLQASKQHQKLNRRSSEGLMSSISSWMILGAFDSFVFDQVEMFVVEAHQTLVFLPAAWPSQEIL